MDFNIRLLRKRFRTKAPRGNVNTRYNTQYVYFCELLQTPDFMSVPGHEVFVLCIFFIISYSQNLREFILASVILKCKFCRADKVYFLFPNNKCTNIYQTFASYCLRPSFLYWIIIMYHDRRRHGIAVCST